ncbi:MAG: hypothetical protein KatS3mg003_2370 [Candidatus Nitrosocaldaceae archaeon]|nr:MAG: hypothetical protein KatS3mg003_2370 [Candidatus Nitrosocaldaceae archaeon]
MLNNEELEALKKPAGILIRDEAITKDKIKEHITDLIISIGDATTERLIKMDIIPDIQIVDGKERRITREPSGAYKHQVRCKNPAGSITYDAVKAFKDALNYNEPVRILVEGEEDLFGLVALAYAPNNSVIFYGQPLEGMVILYVNEESRNRFKSMIDKIISLEGE